MGCPFFSLGFALFSWFFMGCPFLKAFFLLSGFFGFHGVPFRSTARKVTNHGVPIFLFRLTLVSWCSMGCPFLVYVLAFFSWRSMGYPFLKAFFLLGGFFGFHGVPFRSTARKATNHGVPFF